MLKKLIELKIFVLASALHFDDEKSTENHPQNQ